MMLKLALLSLVVASISSSPTGDNPKRDNQATPSSSALRTSPDLMTHVNPPVPSLAATAQYRGATAITITEQGPSLEEYENFFLMVDNLLWDSEESGRGFRRGWLGRPRPQLLMRRNGQAAPFYRAVVDQCYDLMCQLGINGFINRMSRFLS